MYKFIILATLNVFTASLLFGSTPCDDILIMNEGFKNVLRQVIQLTDEIAFQDHSFNSIQNHVNKSDLREKTIAFSNVVKVNGDSLAIRDAKEDEKVAMQFSRSEKSFRKGFYLHNDLARASFKQKWRKFMSDDKAIRKLNVVYYKYCK